MLRQSTRRSVVGLLAGLWVSSLFLPTIDDWGTGWNVLIWGWMGIFFGVVEWLANPLLFIVLAALYLPRRAPGVLLCFATLLGIMFVVSLTRNDIVDIEGGVAIPITDRFAGYYLWMLAIAATTILGLVGEFRSKWLGFDDSANSKE